MAKKTVVYDACVLYPAALRDLLIWLALSNLFNAKWTNEIHDEWIRNVLKNRPDVNLRQLSRTRYLMDNSVLDSLVSGYESIIPNLNLPDPNDRHVLAAAIYSQADIIVTFNLADFPQYYLKNYSLQALHPDAFIVSLIEEDYLSVCQSAQKQRLTLKNPPKTVDEYLGTLHTQGLMKTVAKLKELCMEI
jgi:predicted nucleic acid-binding protein